MAKAIGENTVKNRFAAFRYPAEFEIGIYAHPAGVLKNAYNNTVLWLPFGATTSNIHNPVSIIAPPTADLNIELLGVSLNTIAPRKPRAK